MDKNSLSEKWRGVSYWKKGAIAGLLFSPVLIILLYTVGELILSIFAMFRLEALAGILEVLFMLPFVPALIIHEKLGFVHVSPIYASMFIWTLIGVVIGYLVDKRKGRIKVRK